MCVCVCVLWMINLLQCEITVLNAALTNAGESWRVLL